MNQGQMQNINHVDLLFPSKYLKASDCNGMDQIVTIIELQPRYELTMVGGKKKQKPVIRLREIEKLWVLNKTNVYLISDLHGTELAAWIGKQIIIYPARVKWGKKIVDGIRVRETAPAPAQAQAQQYAPAQQGPPDGMANPNTDQE